jgi:hypothetical protein
VGVKSQIRITKNRFSGGVGLDHAGHFTVDPEGSQYVGEPSREVDAAWRSLLSGTNWHHIHDPPFTNNCIAGLNLDLDATEYNPAGNTYRWEESGLYFTGLEVYHSLHCLVTSQTPLPFSRSYMI